MVNLSDADPIKCESESELFDRNFSTKPPKLAYKFLSIKDDFYI